MLHSILPTTNICCIIPQKSEGLTSEELITCIFSVNAWVEDVAKLFWQTDMDGREELKFCLGQWE
jgi:hypothetical protein